MATRLWAPTITSRASRSVASGVTVAAKGRSSAWPTVEPFRLSAATVTPEATLREALDVIVGAQSRVAMVQDDEKGYLGMVTIDQVAGGLEA